MPKQDVFPFRRYTPFFFDELWGDFLSTFALKLVALLTMFLDHLGEFFPGTTPIWFRWLGRIAAPLFFFCMAQGAALTHNRKAYLLRLYGSSVFMGCGNFLLNQIFPDHTIFLYNNIFSTLFLCVVLVIILDFSRSSRGKELLCLCLFGILQVFLYQMTMQFYHTTGDMKLVYLILTFLPNVFQTEGGITFLYLGCAMYLLRDNKKVFSWMYIAFSIYYFFVANVFGGAYSYQWMMVAALPLILAWDRTKGPSMKRLFYGFYPAHIWILYTLSYFWR